MSKIPEDFVLNLRDENSEAENSTVYIFKSKPKGNQFFSISNRERRISIFDLIL